MRDADDQIAERHAEAPREAFEALRTTQEWRVALDQAPDGEVVTIAGWRWRKITCDMWLPALGVTTADLALWACAKGLQDLGVGLDGFVAPGASDGGEGGDSE